MPLYADIRINEHLIKTINIGRVKGGTGPDDVNTYIALETEHGAVPEWWADDDSITYEHRYGDGAEVCVLKALKALGYDMQPKQSKKWDGNGRNYRA